MTKTKFLFDLGANDGCSIRKFSSILEDFDEYEVHSFEPGQVASSENMTETLARFSNVTLHKQPVSDAVKEVTFWDHTSYSGASTMWEPKALDTRRIGDCGSNISGHVSTSSHTTIDFSQFLLETIKNRTVSDLRIKLDIEGEEYRVIPKMLVDKVFPHVNVIYLEWHPEWAPLNFNQKSTVQAIKRQNPNIVIDATWNALDW